MTAARPTKVLESTRPPDGTTRYIDQVVTFADRRFSFGYLSSPRDALGRVDVLHVHWPDAMVRSGGTVTTALRCAAVAALLVSLRIRRAAIVRTVHNLDPHEDVGALPRRVIGLLDRWTTYTVTINPVVPPPTGRGAYIPHGHYRDRFADHEKATTVPGRLLHAGLIRPYKGIERLLEVVAGDRDLDVTLRIVGQPTAALRAVVGQATSGDARISSDLRFVPDADLVREVTEAELVVLPYSHLHNSGMLLVALSLDRPVLVPDTDAARAMAAEVGPGWVHTFDGVLDADAVRSAIAASRQRSAARPMLDGRDWERVARLYGEAFDAAISLARRGSR